jgi:hypothetical protein
VPLEEVFAAAATRLEAVVTFLCLLELLKRGEVSVESDVTGVVVVVSAVTGGDGTPTRAVHRHPEAGRFRNRRRATGNSRDRGCEAWGEL